MTTFLNEENVERTFTSSLIKKTKNKSKEVKAQCVGQNTTFHRNRLENHKEMILQMLSQLPEEFMSQEGAHFGDAVCDQNGDLWTHYRYIANHLLTMGVAIGAVVLLTPADRMADTPPSQLRIKILVNE